MDVETTISFTEPVQSPAYHRPYERAAHLRNCLSRGEVGMSETQIVYFGRKADGLPQIDQPVLQTLHQSLRDAGILVAVIVRVCLTMQFIEPRDERIHLCLRRAAF